MIGAVFAMQGFGQFAAAMVTLIIVVAFRRYLSRQPRPFSATLRELQDDQTCIRNPS